MLPHHENASAWSRIYDSLVRIANSGASGELIVVGDGCEAHFYVFTGRLAWATSTHTTKAFAAHLQSQGVDKVSLSEVMAECKKAGTSLMQTLVKWDVATLDQVYEALFVQICEALLWLHETESLEKVFVPRNLTYDESQTFSLSEIQDSCARPPTSLRYGEIATEVDAATGRVSMPTELTTVACADAPHDDEQFEETTQGKKYNMANTNESLSRLSEIDGSIGGCVVDSDSGMMLGSVGGGPVNLEIAAAGNTEVVRAKRKTMTALGLAGTIDDILITLDEQYHIIRPLKSNDALFFYLVLDRQKANLAMARLKLRDIAGDLNV